MKACCRTTGAERMTASFGGRRWDAVPFNGVVVGFCAGIVELDIADMRQSLNWRFREPATFISIHQTSTQLRESSLS